MTVLLKILLYIGFAILIGGIITLNEKIFPKKKKIGEIFVKKLTSDEILKIKNYNDFKQVLFSTDYPEILISEIEFKKSTNYKGKLSVDKNYLLYKDSQRYIHKIPLNVHKDVIQITKKNLSNYQEVKGIIGIIANPENYED